MEDILVQGLIMAKRSECTAYSFSHLAISLSLFILMFWMFLYCGNVRD